MISIAGTKLSREVFASDWLAGYCIAHHHEADEIHKVSHDEALSYTSFKLNGSEQIGILRVLVEGSRLFFIQGFSAVENQKYVVETLRKYVESFEFVGSLDGDEQIATYSGMCGKVGYSLEGEWDIREMEGSSDIGAGVDCFSSFPNGSVNCWVRVKFRTAKKIPKLENDMTVLGQDLQRADVVLVKELRNEPIPAEAGFLGGGFIRVFMGYPVGKQDNQVEITCIALIAGSGALSFFFIFPTAQSDYLAWAQGRRTLAGFMASLSVS